MHETCARLTGGAALAVALCLLLAAGVRAKEGGGPPPSLALATFDELYGRIAAAEGAAESASTAAAEEIRFALRTELIRLDAEVEVLKLEAARFNGERQQQALDRLVEAAAARERRLWQAGDTATADEAAKGSIQLSFEAQDVVEDPDP